MPACYCSVIISNVSSIPTKYYITKTKSFFCNRYKFFKADYFATQYAIYISNGQLYFFCFISSQFLYNFFNGYRMFHGVFFLQQGETKYKKGPVCQNRSMPVLCSMSSLLLKLQKR